MRRVIIESPYMGNEDNSTEKHLRYLRACLRDSLLRGEAPFASHSIYTQPGVLDDNIPAEREHGIQAGFAFRSACDATIIYGDLGTRRGMIYGVNHANTLITACRANPDGPQHTIEFRELGPDWDEEERNDDLELESVFATSWWAR